MSQTANFASSSLAADISLIHELYEEIDRNPPAIAARKLLMQQCQQLGWYGAAGDAARQLLNFDPEDEDARACSIGYARNVQQVNEEAVVPAQNQGQDIGPDIEDLDLTRRAFAQGYDNLCSRAQKTKQLLRIVNDLGVQMGCDTICEEHSRDLDALADGRFITTGQVRALRPCNAMVTARAMKSRPDQALDIAISDFKEMVHWLRSQATEPSALKNDAIREALVKRVHALSAALPSDFPNIALTALMHVEHETLGREYVNHETMLGDSIADVIRSHFWVSEDGYAWDMDELAQALKSNDGVMRNPLSREIITTEDVRAIIQHPLGKGLAALHMEQNKLSKGVRPETVERLIKLAQVLSAEVDNDIEAQAASHKAVDEFLAYMATLPEAEHENIDKLRVPARDDRTGQPYDSMIGEAVRDAKMNRVCFRKTGVFLKQAAEYLQSN